jgi:hypothetical protein
MRIGFDAYARIIDDAGPFSFGQRSDMPIFATSLSFTMRNAGAPILAD